MSVLCGNSGDGEKVEEFIKDDKEAPEDVKSRPQRTTMEGMIWNGM